MRHINPRGLLFTTYIGFLCLCQVACRSNSSTEDTNVSTQSPVIDSDKFALEIEDESTQKNNNVKIERKGDNKHTETQSITLTAQQDGETQQVPMPTDAENLQVPIAPESTLKNESLQTSSATSAMTPNSDSQDTSSEENDSAFDSTIAESSDNTTNTSTQQPVSTKFTFTLQDKTQVHNVRNFVLVNIHPTEKNMNLSDLFVTATLSNPRGTAMGSSSKKQNSFVYDKPLIGCSVGELFLQRVNCLGAQDTSFANSEDVVFKIKVKPGAAVNQGTSYTLTVHLTYGKNPSSYTATQSITLTAPSPSPRKAPRSPHLRK